jgi:glyoxylase-like metal-dependent hydrolase (beta-lactamase superfamily II)
MTDLADPIDLQYADLPLIQLFDSASSTFSYLLWDPLTRDAAMIDPVLDQLPRDLALIAAHGLRLRWCIETHAHADHVTGTGQLALKLGATTAAPTHCEIPAAERQIVDGDVLRFGGEELRALHTPGHTAGSTCYLWQHGGASMLFSGDTLLIEGCGRTDFQGGGARALYRSIRQRLFTLPDATRVFPGHDYKGRRASSIGHEKQHNPRLAGRSEDEFTQIMESLNLPRPKLIDLALPANRRLGLDAADVATQ